MAGLNFRIETKLGSSAGLTVGLVGGMHANQLHGHPSIADISRSVSASQSNTFSARTADNRMTRAALAIRDIRAARSAAEFDQGLSAAAPVPASASAWLPSNEGGRLESDVGNWRDTVRDA